VSLEEILVAIRARASVISKEPRPPTIEDALVTLVSHAGGSTPEAMALANILIGMGGMDRPDTDYKKSDVQLLQPRVIRRLDLLLVALLDGRCTQEGLREALRPLKVRPFK
jgi:hypothetical protein